MPTDQAGVGVLSLPGPAPAENTSEMGAGAWESNPAFVVFVQMACLSPELPPTHLRALHPHLQRSLLAPARGPEGRPISPSRPRDANPCSGPSHLQTLLAPSLAPYFRGFILSPLGCHLEEYWLAEKRDKPMCSTCSSSEAAPVLEAERGKMCVCKRR